MDNPVILEDKMYTEVKNMKTYIFPYTGDFIISSVSKSKHNVHIYDGDGKFKTILPPGSSIIHRFQHNIKIMGTSDINTDSAYIYLAHHMEL